MHRVTLLVALLTALLVLVACQSQEPEVATEDQVPEDMVPEEGEDGGDGDGGGGAEGSVEITAVDIDYEDVPDSVSAGTVEFVLNNTGGIEHDLNIEELDQQVVSLVPAGETDSGTAELDPGSYTIFCSVPGHRDSGMEATIEAE